MVKWDNFTHSDLKFDVGEQKPLGALPELGGFWGVVFKYLFIWLHLALLVQVEPSVAAQGI